MTTPAEAADSAAEAAEAAAEAAEEAAESESEPPPETVVVVAEEPAPVEEATGALGFAEAIRGIVREEVQSAESRLMQYVDGRVTNLQTVAVEAAESADEAAEAAEAAAEAAGDTPPPPPPEPDESPEEEPPIHPWFRKRGRK